ncbi:MAG TPA: DUF4252 domain-containing protein [Blastocatellia bacterium]|nr:DUF4252 domain-containing protein [Blastocatellia bacterium]
MKSILISIRLICVAFFAIGLLASAASAQRIQFGDFAQLEAKAAEVVDVTLDEKMLQLASKFLSSKDPEQAKVKEIVAGLKGVYVKSFEFDKDGEYSKEDIDKLRAQVRGPGWSRIVGVTSRGAHGENVEVSIMTEGDRIIGLAVIAAEPRELTIINIVGLIDLDKIAALQGNFGIPRLDLEINRKSDKK